MILKRSFFTCTLVFLISFIVRIQRIFLPFSLSEYNIESGESVVEKALWFVQNTPWHNYIDHLLFIRIGFVLISTITVLLFFIHTKNILLTLVLMVNPVLISYSSLGYSANLALLFIVLGRIYLPLHFFAVVLDPFSFFALDPLKLEERKLYYFSLLLIFLIVFSVSQINYGRYNESIYWYPLISILFIANDLFIRSKCQKTGGLVESSGSGSMGDK